MKQILLLSVLLISLGTQAQTDTTEKELDTTDIELDTSKIKFLKPPDSTGFGTPDGKLVNKEIGPVGGTIFSDDGRVELIFPEGALTANTSISIQPITNMLNGSGKAYQMEPSGSRFKKPVKIIFHYTDEEAETCPPDLKSFALQDHKGNWTFFEYDEWDSTTKKLSGLIHHFSALVTDQNDVKIFPTNSRVRVNRKTEIWAWHRQVYPIHPSLVGVIEPPHEIPEFAGARLGLFVNGIFKGNSIIGTANINSTWQALEATKPWKMTGEIGLYHAPEYLPRESPFEIKLAFQYYSRIKKKIVWGTSKCDINVYDAYEITIFKKGSSGLICGAELEDKSSFKVELYPNNKRPEISDVKNAPPTLTKQSNCPYLKYNPAGCPGPVHVNKNLLFGHGILYDQGAITAPEITLEFVPKPVKIMNKKDRAPNELHDFPADVTGVTVGNMIKFKADRTSQSHNRPGDGASHSFQLIVKPL